MFIRNTWNANQKTYADLQTALGTEMLNWEQKKYMRAERAFFENF